MLTTLHNNYMHFVFSYLLATVYPVTAQDWGAASGDPDASQGVGIHLILLDQALAFLMLQYKYKS